MNINELLNRNKKTLNEGDFTKKEISLNISPMGINLITNGISITFDIDVIYKIHGMAQELAPDKETYAELTERGREFIEEKLNNKKEDEIKKKIEELQDAYANTVYALLSQYEMELTQDMESLKDEFKKIVKNK